MTNDPAKATPNSTAAAGKPETSAEARQIVLSDDLVAQLVGIEKAQAQHEVDAVLKGRHI